MNSSSTIENDDRPAKPPVILALEGSADLLAVAVWADGIVKCHQTHAARYGHASRIALLVKQVMECAELNFTDVTHIAAGRGPGSFTGIRVALAAAKGFCLATGAVGMGINSLEALAANYEGDTPVLVSAETRRGPSYAQLFEGNGRPLTPIFEMELADVLALLPDGLSALVIAGWQADEIAARLAAADSGILMSDVQTKAQIDAANIATYAATLIKADEAGEALTPLYLAPAFLGPAKQVGK